MYALQSERTTRILIELKLNRNSVNYSPSAVYEIQQLISDMELLMKLL